MSESKVVPFRKRPPSENELEIVRKITRNWHPDLRGLLFPDHTGRDRKEQDGK